MHRNTGLTGLTGRFRTLKAKCVMDWIGLDWIGWMGWVILLPVYRYTAVPPRASLQSDANNVMSIIVMVMFTIRAAVKLV